MPTVLMILDWRLFFYTNERNESVHIHCKKGDSECKYWLDIENFNIQEAYIYNCLPRDKRELKKIIYQHFDYIASEWDKFKEAGNE